MTQWAIEVLLALRAAGWPKPKHGRAYAARGGMIGIGEREAHVISVTDKVSISGPPRAVAQTLSYWRDVAG